MQRAVLLSVLLLVGQADAVSNIDALKLLMQDSESDSDSPAPPTAPATPAAPVLKAPAGLSSVVLKALAAPAAPSAPSAPASPAAPTETALQAMAAPAAPAAPEEEKVQAAPATESKHEANVVSESEMPLNLKLEATQEKNEKLEHLLIKSVHSNKALMQKMKVLKKKLQDDEEAQDQMKTEADDKVASEEAKTAAESQRAVTAETKLEKETKQVKLRKKAMNIIGKKLTAAQKQLASFQVQAATASEHEAAEAKILSATQQQVEDEKRELAQAKAQIEQLKATEIQKETRAKVLRKQAITGMAMQKQNVVLKRTLVREVQREKQLRQKLSSESNAFKAEVRKERATDAALQKARFAFVELRKRADNLGHLANKIQHSQHEAASAAKNAQAALAESRVESAQLNKKNKWLESLVVDQERQASQKATMHLQEVLREQDALQGVLAQGPTGTMKEASMPGTAMAGDTIHIIAAPLPAAAPVAPVAPVSRAPVALVARSPVAPVADAEWQQIVGNSLPSTGDTLRIVPTTGDTLRIVPSLDEARATGDTLHIVPSLGETKMMHSASDDAVQDRWASRMFQTQVPTNFQNLPPIKKGSLGPQGLALPPASMPLGSVSFMQDW